MRDILDPQDRWLGAPGGFLSSSNKAPTAIDDVLSVAMNSGPVTVDVLANDSDPEGQPLTLISASAALGTAVAEADNTVTYTPPAGISGFDTVIYEVADDLNKRRTAQVDITITGPTLTLTTLSDNTMVIEADPSPLDLTITQPGPFAGTYMINAADLGSGPLNLVGPSVSGSFLAGQTLTAAPGLWIYDTIEGGPTQSWQWRLNGSDISGATAPAYTVQSGDIGQSLEVVEIQNDNAGQRFAATLVPGGPAGFQPAADTGLLGWWDATDSATISHFSGTVTSWADKTGAGALLQGDSSRSPVTGTRSLNGLNILDFSGNDYLSDATRALPASGDVAFHMMVAIDGADNAFESILSVEATNDFQLDAFSSTQFDGQLNAAGIGTPTTLSGGPFSGAMILSLIFDRTGTGTAEVFVSNVSRAVMTYTAPLDSAVALFVMCNRTQNARADGAVGELVLTTSLGNRTDYHAYLAAKWGLT